VKLRYPILVLTLAVPLLGAGQVLAEENNKPNKDFSSFGALRPLAADEARGQAQAWLKEVGKTDATSQKAFDAIWSDANRTTLDRVSKTLALGDAEAAKLLTEARDPSKAAPTAVPALIKDTKKPAFYRANLGLAYGKALSSRRVYEESLETLKNVKAEQVVDPGAYLFHRAVAEHALMLKDDALRSIIRLLDDAIDVPDRYRLVSVLMALDMQQWKSEKDLGWISRKMDNIERRLDLSRAGPQTQKIQKEVVARLDEIIKDLENQCKGDCNGGCCPNGGSQGSAGGSPTSPQRDSFGGKNAGPGRVDAKQLEQIAKGWGKLPEKEKAQAMQDMTRDMPAKYREVIESYFKKLAASDSAHQ